MTQLFFILVWIIVQLEQMKETECVTAILNFWSILLQKTLFHSGLDNCTVGANERN